jgi:flagellar hook-associated protein 2
MALAPTAGNFTVNGQPVALVAGDTWADLQTKISAATGGAVTLNLGVNGVSLTSSSPVQLGSPSDSSNFLSATQLLGAAQKASAYTTTSSGALGSPAADMTPATLLTAAGMTTAPTAGNFTINGQTVAVLGGDSWADVQGKISTATGGAVTLNLGVNSVSLTSSSSIQLGAVGDTSNFLAATRLSTATQAITGYTVASNQLLGEAQANNPLTSAGLAIPGGINAGGAFQVNGVSISWANTDSINGILSRINASAAGVTATYDPKLDKVNLTNSNTGAQNISLVDSTGNLLQALNLTGATQTFGSAAEYTTTQNGVASATQYSNSNTVQGAVQGVNVTLLGTGTTSISTTQDTTTAIANVNAFITQFNSMVDLLDTDTRFDPTSRTGGVLSGDAAITGLASQMRGIASRMAIVPAGSAYTTLGDIGISTGAYGSTVGTTNHLVLNASKLTAALTNNPQAVTQVLAGLTGTTAAVPGAPNPWVGTATGTPYGQVYSGSYKVTFNPIGNTLSSVFTSSNGSIQKATIGTIGPGGTNTALIPGISIVALNPLPLVASTETINYTVSGRGILQSMNDFVSQSRGPNGIFTAQHTNATSSVARFATQIANQNALLAQRQASLQAQFTAMEVALGTLQAQGASLASSIGSLSNSQSSNN